MGAVGVDVGNIFWLLSMSFFVQLLTVVLFAMQEDVSERLLSPDAEMALIDRDDQCPLSIDSSVKDWVGRAEKQKRMPLCSYETCQESWLIGTGCIVVVGIGVCWLMRYFSNGDDKNVETPTVSLADLFFNSTI